MEQDHGNRLPDAAHYTRCEADVLEIVTRIMIEQRAGVVPISWLLALTASLHSCHVVSLASWVAAEWIADGIGPDEVRLECANTALSTID